MKLYWLVAENRYVHRQADIPKGMEAESRDIPTDLQGLMGLLNDLCADIAKLENDIAVEVGAEASYQMPKAPLIDIPPPPSGEDEPAYVDPDPPMSACRIVTQIDNPHVDVDAIVENIAKAKGQTLRRYAGAVAVRFEELSKK